MVVFPTELALRRFQQEQALEHGFVDASGHTTFARLRELCLPYARLKGQRMTAPRKLLMRNQVVDVAQGHFAGQGSLGELSESALCEVLDQLVNEMASLPGDVSLITDWMLDRPHNYKLHQLGTLFSIWRAILKQDGYVDALDINLAVLKLLKGKRSEWPPLLRDARQIIFRSVRWFNAFEEACVTALTQKMKIRVESALPPAHAEAAADRLGQRIRAELMTTPWIMWAEDLGDALAVDTPELLNLEELDRIDFSRSAGAYGEVEDLARRICWHLQSEAVTPDRIALVVPNIGAVQDIIPHVFGRFQIPYFFRRGRPVLSSPVVKTFLSWLSFPLRPERDTLLDLIRNPAIHCADREGVEEHLLKMPPRLGSGQIEQLRPALEFSALEKHPISTVAEALQVLKDRMVAPEDHFNVEALKTLSAAMESFGDRSMPLQDLIDLLEELLENATVKPRDSHEQGVWILNPHDAVGLDFDIVMFAGLNEGEFPSIPQQDALLNDDERHWLRCYLEEQGRHLPALALPKADVVFEQQSVLFLTVLGMARQQLVLSYQSVDQEGNEKSGSEYFRKLWTLAGWCAQELISPGQYDQWRIRLAGENSGFIHHVVSQQSTVPEDRVPMPGESFLTVVPLALCRAEDEALQAAVCMEEPLLPRSADDGDVASSASIDHLMAMLKIESERQVFLDSLSDERISSIYCGQIPAWKEAISVWLESKQELSPTALEKLAHGRYIFLLEQVFGLRDERMTDDTPDPLDRGSLIHAILKEIYTAIALGETGIETPRLWAVKTTVGWKRRTEGGVDAIPLAVFVPEQEEAYVAFARKLTERRMNLVELGHSGVWQAERQKVLEQILNFVRYDAQNCIEDHRYPAMMELKFAGESAVDLGEVRLKGQIDRIDLVFTDHGELEKIRVLDYKGSSRALGNHDDYLDDIRRNLDCQLPIYALAAQQYFFGQFNTDVTNARTEAGYLFYERRLSDVASKSKKSLVSMDEDGLIDAFLQTLYKNIHLLKEGDFSVDPLIVSYTDYESICRTSAIARDELD